MWLRLSLGCLFSSFVKGQGEFLKGVSWGSHGRLEVKGPKVLCSCGQAPPQFPGAHSQVREMETPPQGACCLVEGAGGPEAGTSAEVPTVLIQEGQGAFSVGCCLPWVLGGRWCRNRWRWRRGCSRCTSCRAKVRGRRMGAGESGQILGAPGAQGESQERRPSGS